MVHRLGMRCRLPDQLLGEFHKILMELRSAAIFGIFTVSEMS